MSFLNYCPLLHPDLSNALHPTWVVFLSIHVLKSADISLVGSSLTPFAFPNSRALLFALLLAALFFKSKHFAFVSSTGLRDLGRRRFCVSELCAPRLSTLRCVVGIRDRQINSEKTHSVHCLQLLLCYAMVFLCPGQVWVFSNSEYNKTRTSKTIAQADW